MGEVALYRFRAKRQRLNRFLEEIYLKSQGQNLALTVLHVPCSLDRSWSRVFLVVGGARPLATPDCHARHGGSKVDKFVPHT
jgi:hypothetical protein